MPARERDHAAPAKHAEQVETPHAPQSEADPKTISVATGAIPPVATEDFQAPPATASERAYGKVNAGYSSAPPGNDLAAAPSKQHASDIERTDYIYGTAKDAAAGILGALVPGYLIARDALDLPAVAELGGKLIGAFNVVHGAKTAFEQMLRTVPKQSVRGATVNEDAVALATQERLSAAAPGLDALMPAVDHAVATAITPHLFHGREVAGQPVIVDLSGPSGASHSAKLIGELQRTIGMLSLLSEIKALELVGKKGANQKNLDTARGWLTPWATRPLDIAFLRAALGHVWELLDATVSGPLDAKPSNLLDSATKQAKHTGWLGDIGRFDIEGASGLLQMGGRESAEQVLFELNTTDPDTRARLLIQIKERGLLDTLCSAVGWAQVKALHDSLGYGFSDIKKSLQHYFIDTVDDSAVPPELSAIKGAMKPFFTSKNKYGPSTDEEWDSHDSSSHSVVGKLGGLGSVLNFVLDVGTFGFNSSYGKALDDQSEGRTTEAEGRQAKAHAAAKTAAIAIVSTLTGGMADKAIRGGGAAVSTGRAIAGGAAGGSVGAATGLGASDAYGVYVSGDQQRFSSPEEYVKAALLGGVIGGALGGVTHGLSNRAAGYLPEPVAELPETTAASSESTTSAGERSTANDLGGERTPTRGAEAKPAAEYKMATSARPGLDATPESIAQGTVRMELHPDFPRVVSELAGKGYTLKYASTPPHVEAIEVVRPNGEPIRVDRAVVVQEGMRFIDLEHEVGHVRQLEGMKEPLVTKRLLEDGRDYRGTNHGGLLTENLNRITEYHNRLLEFFRLKERGVDPAILKDHAAGVREAYSEYWGKAMREGRARSNAEFVRREFPDLADLEARFTSEEGSL